MGEEDKEAASGPRQSSTSKRKQRGSKQKRAEENPGSTAVFTFSAAVFIWGFLNISCEQRPGLGETVRSLPCVTGKAKQVQRM